VERAYFGDVGVLGGQIVVVRVDEARSLALGDVVFWVGWKFFV
jgi:hypothetical protein